LFGACLLTPALASAQSAIAGRVTTESGDPLVGVEVDAASDALIERSRKAVTDDSGRYRIEELRPGRYQVTFLVSGAGSPRATTVDLAGSVTARVDLVLTASAVAETVTVTGASPAIDAHRATSEITMSGALVRTIPTARTYNALLPFVPGVLTNNNDTVTATATTSFPIHGGRVTEGRFTLDGFTVGSPPSGNSATSYDIDPGTADEVTFVTQGALGESETGGLVMNVVPKSGGNTRHGSVRVSGTTARLQADNLTDESRSQGATAASPLSRVYDVSGTFGGPLKTDRVWYFAAGHVGGSRRESPNVFANANAGDPNLWTYVADPALRSYSDRTFENASLRLTWQVSPRNKIGAFWDAQALCRRCTGATPGLSEPQRISPEAVGVLGRPLHVAQVTWTSPVSTRLLVDAGFTGTYFGVGNFEREPNPTRGLVRVTEQCAAGCSGNGGIPGLVYRSQDFSVAYTGSYLWKGTLSYVTGRHSVKVGYQHTFMTDNRTWYTNDRNLSYRLNNGIPNQLTQSISPWVNNARAAWDGLYVQDQWTTGQLTLHGALRFDRSSSWFPAQQEGPSRFLPSAIQIPETRGVDSYMDLTPRVAATYDVSGRGRTVVRASVGKYLDGVGVSGTYANTNPTLRLPQTTSVFGTAGVTRAWNDANRNFAPDCDLLNPAAQDLTASGGDLCGVLSNTNFGQSLLTNAFDPALLRGWNVRPSDWNFGISVQQSIASRSAVVVTYTRRWFHGFSVVDNRALQAGDLTPFSVTAPLDARLPGGGGYVVTGLYDVVPEKAGQVDNLVTDARTIGAWSQHYEGLDVNVDIRGGRDLRVVAGTSTGQTVADNCDVRARLPELSTAVTGTSAFGAGLNGSAVTPVSPYCHVRYGVQTQLRGLATYTVPKIDLQVAATFQSKPGALLAANYAVPNSAVVPSLGRNLSGNAANVTVNLIEPGTQYGDRINQLDIRIGKLLRPGRSRLLLAVDTFNLLNSSAVLSYDNTYVPGGPWLQPLAVLTPRFVKLSAEFEF
jgi:hypothetical protein